MDVRKQGKRVGSAFRSVYQRRKELTRKIVKNPFFPILFIGEAVKTAVIAYASTGAFINPVVIALALAAIVVTITWIFAEVILESAKDAAEEVTDSD